MSSGVKKGDFIIEKQIKGVFFYTQQMSSKSPFPSIQIK